jgi:hypothetical protein
MNSPEQQATLYRKAAETIEMCAKHGVEPLLKIGGALWPINKCDIKAQFECYEFPITVLDGQLVWADTVVYNKRGVCTKAAFMVKNCGPYTLAPPKQPLCMVEGKPVYKGSEVYDGNGCKIIADRSDGVNIYGSHCDLSRVVWDINLCSWSPKPKTVMVELLVEDAESLALADARNYYYGVSMKKLSDACRKALFNLKGDKS